MLPNRTRYQTLAEVEARLSYDTEALLALCHGCRQPSTQKGAWNLLLLALSRYLTRYLKDELRNPNRGEDLDTLLEWVTEAIVRQANPLSFLRRAAGHARQSRAASQARELATVREAQAGEALEAYEGEDRVWVSWLPASDPFLREQLQTALAKLSPKQLRAFLLVEVNGLTSPEAGLEMGVSPKTVRNLATEARKILRDTLRDDSANDS